MGAWGYKNFENDIALDWFGEFERNPTVEYINDTFDYIIGEEDYLESDESFEALACAEVVLNQLDNNYLLDLPQENNIDNIKLDISKDIIKSAIASLEKILYSEISELRELWIESDDFDDWLAMQEKLLKNLKQYL